MLFILSNIFTLVFWIIFIETQTDLFILNLAILGILCMLALTLIGLCINWWIYVVGIEGSIWHHLYSVLPKLLSGRQFNFLTTLITLFFILGTTVFFSSYFFNPLLGFLIFIIIMGISALLITGITVKRRSMLSLARPELIKVWIQFILMIPLVVLASFITIELYTQTYLFTFLYLTLSLIILGFLTWPFIGLWFIWQYYIRYKEGKIIYKGKIWKIPAMEYHPHSELLKLLGKRQLKPLTILIFLLLIMPLIIGLFLLLFFKLSLAFIMIIIALSIPALVIIGIIMKYRRMISLSHNEYMRLWLQFILILLAVVLNSFIINNMFGNLLFRL
jgi:hypothetical protein